MNTIIDPVNGNSYDIFSFEGKNLLKNYVKVFQNGGDRSDVYNTSFSSEKDEALDNEKKRCFSTRNMGPYCNCINSYEVKKCTPNKYIGSTPNLKHSHKSIAEHHVNTLSKTKDDYQQKLKEEREQKAMALPKGGFICPSCKKTLETIEGLEWHWLNGTHSVKCNVCDNTFNSNRDLLIHQGEHIQNNENDSKQISASFDI